MTRASQVLAKLNEAEPPNTHPSESVTGHNLKKGDWVHYKDEEGNEHHGMYLRHQPYQSHEGPHQIRSVSNNGVGSKTHAIDTDQVIGKSSYEQAQKHYSSDSKNAAKLSHIHKYGATNY